MSLFKSIFASLLVLLSVIVLISTIIYVTPVDPARLTFGQRADAETVKRKKQELHLDAPLYKQILFYINDVSPIGVGDVAFYRDKGVKSVQIIDSLHIKTPYLRHSYQSGKSVVNLLLEAVPKTLILALLSILMAFVLGGFLGSVAAIYKDTWLDRIIVGGTVLGISVPSYVSAIVLALVFGYILRDITGLNIQGSIFDLDDLGNERVYLKNLILPVLALGVRPLSIITQLMRSSLLDVMNANYIRTAQAKGLRYIDAIRKHGFKNALNPVLTATTGWFASLLAGAFFVEEVFNFKGVGELTINALINYDIPVLLGSILFICTVFIVINILVDVMYRWLDPRLRD